jgi:hypothetical protein
MVAQPEVWRAPLECYQASDEAASTVGSELAIDGGMSNL